MSSNPDQVTIQNIYKLAVSARDFEINQLVQRNNFFMIFQGVLFAGIVQASGNGKVIPIVSFLVCFAGLSASIFQVGMAAGAKFWQERWEHAVEVTERHIIDFATNDPSRSELYEIFTVGDEYINGIVNSRMKGKFIGGLVRLRFSPSRLPIYVGVLFSIIWTLLLMAQISGPLRVPEWLVGFK